MIKFKKKKANKAPKQQEKKVPIGRTIKTKDKYLPHKESQVKQLKEKRWVVVVDKNTNEELAIVKLTTQKTANTTQLKRKSQDMQKGNKKVTYFGHFVEIEGKDKKPIKIDNDKFIENYKYYDLSKEEIKQIQNVVYHKVKQSKTNNEKIKKLKSRDKK